MGPDLVAAWRETEQHKAEQLGQQRSAEQQSGTSDGQDRRQRSQVWLGAGVCLRRLFAAVDWKALAYAVCVQTSSPQPRRDHASCCSPCSLPSGSSQASFGAAVRQPETSVTQLPTLCASVSQGGRRSYPDDSEAQDRYRVITFDGQEVPLEEAFADSVAAEAAAELSAANGSPPSSNGSSNGASNGSGKPQQQQAAEQELELAEAAAELVG